MKTTLHIPTEQFGFLEVEFEAQNEAEALEKYQELSNLAKGGEGVSQGQLEAFVKKQLLGEGNSIEEYNQMSKPQQDIVQMIKRLKKQINYKLSKEE